MKIARFHFNCFRPYLQFRNYSQMHDHFQFHIFWCNYIGMTIGIFGYTMTVGVVICDPLKGGKI